VAAHGSAGRVVWSKWNKRNDHFLLVTRLGFYKAEGESGDRVVHWSDVDRILRWQKEGADFVLVNSRRARRLNSMPGAYFMPGAFPGWLRPFVSWHSSRRGQLAGPDPGTGSVRSREVQ